MEHRLEQFLSWRGIRFYNDSAATIPHATVQAIRALSGAVVLITGGTDKNIDFSPLADAVKAPRAIVLLSGTGTEKIRPLLSAAHVSADGPFDNLKDAVSRAIALAVELSGGRGPDAPQAGGVSILFSPGCTSFGMFLNEFDRGRKFKETAAALTSTEVSSP